MLDLPSVTSGITQNVGISGTCIIRKPKTVLWTPQPDITAYELARCQPFLIQRWDSMSYPEDYIPEGCERHFEIKDATW